MYKGQKRTDYLAWDDYFMNVAILAALRSKDPSTQVGACIVNRDNVIVGVGYNGFPTNISDDLLPWNRDGVDNMGADITLDTKYPYVCHAQMNAILNRTPGAEKAKDCRIFTTLFPCSECCKLIIQSKITKVIYCCDKHGEKESWLAGKRMLALAGVKVEPFDPRPFSISLKSDESTTRSGIVRKFEVAVERKVMTPTSYLHVLSCFAAVTVLVLTLRAK